MLAVSGRGRQVRTTPTFSARCHRPPARPRYPYELRDGWFVGHLLAHATGNKPTFETVETLARLVPAIKAVLADGMKSDG